MLESSRLKLINNQTCCRNRSAEIDLIARWKPVQSGPQKLAVGKNEYIIQVKGLFAAGDLFKRPINIQE